MPSPVDLGFFFAACGFCSSSAFDLGLPVIDEGQGRPFGMSLVDYDSDSSGEEHGDKEEEGGGAGACPLPSSPSPISPIQASSVSGNQHSVASTSVLPPVEKLPDVASLFASPLLSSHVGRHRSSIAAASKTEMASRKREPNGSTIGHPHSKLPRASLPQSRSAPDTVGGSLIPPQIRGRSNVATEDIGKLFVSKQHSGRPTATD